MIFRGEGEEIGAKYKELMDEAGREEDYFREWREISFWASRKK